MALAPSIIINLPGVPINNVQAVGTIADLRMVASAALVNGQNIIADGFATVADGGGGLYTWNDLSTANDNGTTTIKPDDTAPLAAGRWIGITATAGETAAAEAQEALGLVNAAKVSIDATAIVVAGDAATATTKAGEAAISASNAANSALSVGFYAGALANVPRGITAVNVTNAGTGGGADAVDVAMVFSGGNFSVLPTGLFDRVGGVIVNPRLTGGGLYVGAAPTAPTATFPGSGAGFAFNLTTDFLVPSGATYQTDHATDPLLGQMVRNNAGAPFIIVGATYLKAVNTGVQNATVGGTANAITLATTPAVTDPNNVPLVRFRLASTLTATGLAGSRVTLAMGGVNGGIAADLVDADRINVSARIGMLNNELLVAWIPAWSQWLLVAGASPVARLVLCTVVSGGNTANPVVRLPHSGIRLNGDFSGTYFEFIPTADKPVGGAGMTIQASNGTVLVTGVFREYDTVSNIPEGGWLANEPIRFERLASGIMRRVPIAPAAKLRQPREWLQEMGNPELPGQLEMQDLNRMIVKMKNTAVNHRNGYSAAHDDHVTINLINIGKLYPTHSSPVMTVPELWDITATKSRMMGQDIVWDNFNYSSILAATANTGLPPSAGALAIAGDTTGTAAQINAGNLSGFFHGRVNVTALTIIATNNAQSGVVAGGGILNGAVLSVGTDVRTLLTPDSDLSFDTLTITQTMTIAGPSNPVTGIFSTGVVVTHIFDANNGTLEKRVYVPFGPTALMTFGYLPMLPFQWPNKMDHMSIADVPTLGVNVGPGAPPTGVLPTPRRLELYRTEMPSHRLRLAIPAGFTPYQVDGVSPVTPPEQVIINSDTHGKFYITCADDASTIENVANKVYEGRFILSWLRADTFV